MNNSITKSATLPCPIPGVTVFAVSGEAKRGVPQEVLVVVEPGVTIPRHSHETAAHMRIAAGTAIVLSNDEHDGKEVGPGFCVFFAAEKLHGFVAGALGLSFFSANGGIVDAGGDWDIQFAT